MERLIEILPFILCITEVIEVNTLAKIVTTNGSLMAFYIVGVILIINTFLFIASAMGVFD